MYILIFKVCKRNTFQIMKTKQKTNKAGYPAQDAPGARYTAFFKMLTDGHTDTRTHGRTDGRTHPLIEMRRRI